jgi:cytochrome c oxidase cbb3-type subunit II
MSHKREMTEKTVVLGGMVMLAFATMVLVIVPYFNLKIITPPKGLKPYTTAQLRGRAIYIREGCVYCHTQQPRDKSQAPDASRGWGRASVAGDYYYDSPHLLGTSRTGPDLFNIGVRQPSADWHLGHLFQPRAYVPGSIMPSFPYLFDVKDVADEGERVLQLPPEFAPPKKVVVATPAAVDLVKYLQSLDHSYPAIDRPAR